MQSAVLPEADSTSTKVWASIPVFHKAWWWVALLLYLLDVKCDLVVCSRQGLKEPQLALCEESPVSFKEYRRIFLEKR